MHENVKKSKSVLWGVPTTVHCAKKLQVLCVEVYKSLIFGENMRLFYLRLSLFYFYGILVWNLIHDNCRHVNCKVIALLAQ